MQNPPRLSRTHARKTPALGSALHRNSVRGRRHHLDEALARLPEPLPSLAVPVFYVFSALAVILALKRLDLSMAYAIWSGVGTALAAMIGITYFREPLTLFKIASLMLVILGVVGLSLAARQTN